MNYSYYNFNRPNNFIPANRANMNPSQNDERVGFLGPFVLGGITGGLVAPFFYGNTTNNRPRPVYYYPPYYPYRPY